MSAPPGDRPATVRESPFVLRVRAGERLHVFSLNRGVQRVGSLADNDVALPFPGVSRRHALLIVDAERVVVEDLASKNGLWVDGERRERAELGAGSRVAFGTTEAEIGRAASADRVAIGTRGGRSDRSPAGQSAAPTTHRELGKAGVDPETLDLAARLVDALPARPAGPWTPFVEELALCLGVDGLALEDRRRPAAVLLARVGEPDPASGDLPDLSSAGLRLWGPPRWSPGQEVWARFALRLAAGRRSPDGEARTAHRPALTFPPDWVVGSSAAIHRLYREVAAVAPSELPVLLVGETGVGKEGIARLLHASSPRREGPFVPVNCAAIPETLLEAELFGVARAVATGVEPRKGQLEQASGGTLFLDEIGDMAPALQAKLLRVLQEHRILPLGGTPRTIDVRIVAATNADLDQAIAQGSFRADLYYRLAGARLHVPALSERREDVPALVEHFFLRACDRLDAPPRGLSRGLVDHLCARSWPGNVRELEHEVERLVLRSCGGEVLGLDPSGTTGASGEGPGSPPPSPAAALPTLDLERLERQAIETALAATSGNRTRAARLLGLSRSALRRRLARLGLDGDDRPAGSGR